MPRLMEKNDSLRTVAEVEVDRRKSAHDLIGYCNRFNPEYRSTADIMRELREGEAA